MEWGGESERRGKAERRGWGGNPAPPSAYIAPRPGRAPGDDAYIGRRAPGDDAYIGRLAPGDDAYIAENAGNGFVMVS